MALPLAIPAIAKGLFTLLGVGATTHTIAKATGLDEAMGKGIYNLTRDEDQLSSDQLDLLQSKDDEDQEQLLFDRHFQQVDDRIAADNRATDAWITQSEKELEQNQLLIDDMRADKKKQKVPQVLGLLGALMGEGKQNGYLEMLDNIGAHRNQPIVPRKYYR
jgi:hypothetical protein